MNESMPSKYLQVSLIIKLQFRENETSILNRSFPPAAVPPDAGRALGRAFLAGLSVGIVDRLVLDGDSTTLTLLVMERKRREKREGKAVGG